MVMGLKKGSQDSKKLKKKNGKDQTADAPLSGFTEKTEKPDTKKEPRNKKEGAPQPQVPQVAQCAKSGQQVVAKWVQRALDMGVEALRAEYRALAKYTLPEMTWEAFKNNHEAGRNSTAKTSSPSTNSSIFPRSHYTPSPGSGHLTVRFRHAPGNFAAQIHRLKTYLQSAEHFRYQDVPCQDQHRIVLKWPGAPTDYIHANYVGTP
ncbi:hypothetical protein OSTOST_19803, partial [Ostertagia ostertagi]